MMMTMMMMTLAPALQLQEMTSRCEHVKDSDMKFLCDCRDFNMGDLDEKTYVVWVF